MADYIRGVFSQFGENGETVCWGFTFIASLGPILILAGLWVSTGHIGNPGGKRLYAYNNAVKSWDATGYDAFVAQFPADTPIVLTLSTAGLDKTNVSSTSVTLEPYTSQTPLASRSKGQVYPTSNLYFQGDLDIWNGVDAWPSTDQYFSFDMPSFTVAQPVNILSYLCQDLEMQIPCNGVTGAASRRSLMGKPAPTCTGYFRQVNLTSSVTLFAQPPKANDGNWSLNAFQCDQGAMVLNYQIDEALYNEDMSKLPWPGANPDWCGGWSSMFPARPNTTVITFRAYEDPYIQSGLTTNCEFKYGLSKADYDEAGHMLYTPGMYMIGVCAIFLAILTVRYKRLEDREAINKLNSLKGEGTPLATRTDAVEGSSTAGSYGATAKRMGFSRVQTAS